MRITIIAIIVITSVNCSNNSKGENVIVPEAQNDSTVVEKPKKIESVTEEEYWGYDTLLLSEFVSDNGNEIKLRGSLSGFLYRVSVKSVRTGQVRDFDVAENPYIASHSSVLWDSDDFVFVRFGCGTSCWGGLALPLRSEEEPRVFMNYVYQDSVGNIVAYPDSNDLQVVILEDIKNEKFLLTRLNLCMDIATPIDLIESSYKEKQNEVIFQYMGSDCKTIEERSVSLEELRN